MKRAMAAEAEAARNARAKVIAAEGEHKSSRALRHAAEVIMDSPAALQVKLTINTLIFGLFGPASPIMGPESPAWWIFWFTPPLADGI